MLNKQTKDGKTALIVSAKNNKMGVYNWLSTNEVNENLKYKDKTAFQWLPRAQQIKFQKRRQNINKLLRVYQRWIDEQQSDTETSDGYSSDTTSDGYTSD